MFVSSRCSLAALLGHAYTDAAVSAADVLGILPRAEAEALAAGEVELYPASRQQFDDALLDKVGRQVIPPMADEENGAPTDSFAGASHNALAPVGSAGCLRLGEDGKLYFAGKSEHYHASLGHNFPGYRLVDTARQLGIDNCTHNNTRGYIIRKCERAIVAAANGLDPEDAAMADILASRAPKVLNRVINLETGSLAVEAGIKMMLARFYRLDHAHEAPKYAGKTPVFFVMRDHEGGPQANYHGTTVIAQTFRGMWPELYAAAEANGLYKVVPVAINDINDFAEKMALYNSGTYKTAGFLHEIILMNYGAIRLTEEYLHACYRLCRETDTPVLVDEIQSCMWYPGMFLFRQYGLEPDFAVIGKGFPGGQYPASRILTTAEMDNLNQFGALVTNGQEELAALSYLITMKFALENKAEIARLGTAFQNGMEALAHRHPTTVVRAEGLGHLASLHFRDVAHAVTFSKLMNAGCVDVSAQTYKADCPPAALVKPPLTTTDKGIRLILDRMEEALTQMDAKEE